MKHLPPLPVPVVPSAVLFLVYLGATDLWAPDAACFAEVAREVVRPGARGPGFAMLPPFVPSCLCLIVDLFPLAWGPPAAPDANV